MKRFDRWYGEQPFWKQLAVALAIGLLFAAIFYVVEAALYPAASAVGGPGAKQHLYWVPIVDKRGVVVDWLAQCWPPTHPHWMR